MGQYVSDFVTGVSLGHGERAIAVVIAQKLGGWPDPIKAAAFEPVHPSDRFAPASLPLRGFIDGQGFFRPDLDQLPYDLLMKFTASKDWDDFSGRGMRDADGGIDLREFPSSSRNVIFGISVMRPSTFAALIEFWPSTWDGEQPVIDVVKIVSDARLALSRGDQRYWNLAHYFTTSPTKKHVMQDGTSMKIPMLMHALSDGHGWELYDMFKSFLNRQYQDASQPDVAQLFTHLKDFQRLSYGLNRIARFFTPGNFVRHQNLLDITAFQMKVLESQILGLASHPDLGAEMNDDIGMQLAATSIQLQRIREVIHDEFSQLQNSDEYLNAEESHLIPRDDFEPVQVLISEAASPVILISACSKYVFSSF